jgi:NitT/TauT family transport system substrate-binding protein
VRFAQPRNRVPGHSPGGIRRRRVLPLAIAALAVVPLAASCQGSGSSGNQASGHATLTVAATPGVDTAPLFIGIKNGAFSRAGLTIKVRSYGSVAAELQALGKGDVDIAAGDYVDFFAQVANAPHLLSIVADGYHGGPGVMEVLTLPNSGISTPQDLAGKTIGTTGAQGIKAGGAIPYNIDTLATQSVLQNDGVNLSKVRWKPMQPGQLIHALSSGQVPAILVEEPLIYEAESRLGAVPVVDSCSGATANFPLSGYFATHGFARQSEHAINTFRRVLDRVAVAAAVPGPVRAEIASEPHMGMDTASLVTIGTYPTTVSAASLKRVAQLMFSFEMLNHGIDVGKLIAP